jgi:hypothetical protein
MANRTRNDSTSSSDITPGIIEKLVMNKSVRLIDTIEGADFEIDLSYFPEPEPIFAYVDDLDCRVMSLSGLVIAGRMTIENQPDFMWLEGARNCVILKTCKQPGDAESVQKFVSLRSLSVGEFCLEIYHVQPDGNVELLHQNDFIFK